MPPPLYTQSTIALIWDFDKTLTHGYMQEPLFTEYGVDGQKFWAEVNALEEYYGDKSLDGPARVGKDTIYLNHILTYVRKGIFTDLTNKKLRELGARVRLAPGLPEFFDRMRDIAKEDKYAKHDISIEHYIVSTGLRPMIEGSRINKSVQGIWACELLPEAAAPGFREQPPGDRSPVVAQVGYTIDNTSKTRAIFEINKGVNKNSNIEVNTVVPEDQRRVPIQNMIYIADGPSDVPSFSLVNSKGGRTLGVYAPGDANYDNAALLEEQGRVNSIAEANYTPNSPADRWLRRTIRQMADRIVEDRESVLASYSGTPEHKV